MFGKLIKARRISLGESQKVFGERFGVKDVAVSLWESEKREAPYTVLSFVLQDMARVPIQCDKCNGTGRVLIETTSS